MKSVEALKRWSVEANDPAAEFTITISNHQRARKLNVRFLKEIVAALFAELKLSAADLEINLVGAKEMAGVNWDFLQHEGSTDVITFDYTEPVNGGANLPASRSRKGGKIHGELFVCIDDAILQARQFKTTWPSETVRYTVHGVLHLLGYDDLKPDLRRVMKREEHRLTKALTKKFPLSKLSSK